MPGKKGVPRRHTSTPDYFRQLGKKLKEIATRMESLAGMMEQKKLKSVDVDGHASMLEGVKAIKRFRSKAFEKIEAE